MCFEIFLPRSVAAKEVTWGEKRGKQIESKFEIPVVSQRDQQIWFRAANMSHKGNSLTEMLWKHQQSKSSKSITLISWFYSGKLLLCLDTRGIRICFSFSKMEG